MGSVTTVILGFVIFSLLARKIYEAITFFFKSNVKYHVIDYLANYVYYGKDIGLIASLSLDSPSRELLERRMKGQKYLENTLTATSVRGKNLASKLVDCRFALAKVCVPLMRELEFPPNRNFVTELRNKKQQGNVDEKEGSGMFEVVAEDGKALLYVGNDAVHTLGAKSFYEPVQNEINKRMSLSEDVQNSMFRFAPIAMNVELEENVDRILRLTGMEEVRYSLSGSEAMDAAFKDIKSTCRGKKVIVRFTSAYHGHVSGVDFLNCGTDHIFLKECSDESIEFIEKYHYRIAAVVVNPMQHFTGINKASPPGEKLTVSSRTRESVPRETYAQWLHDLQDKCNYCTEYLTKVAFVLDDIYFAFRTPELFSKDYFSHPSTGVSLKPNVMVIGKGVAAGYPLSMILAQKGYLNTYDKKYLLQVNKTVGTLTAWHGGIVASNVFLKAITDKYFLKTSAKDQLAQMVFKFDEFRTDLNEAFLGKNLPLEIRNFSNTFSINYKNKSLYNSRYPQYLLAEGLFLGNYSTGKFNLNADVTRGDLKVISNAFVRAGEKMKNDGFFEPIEKAAQTKLVWNVTIKLTSSIMRVFYDQIMKDKHIDIEVSHNHPVNKFGHFWSSIFMIFLAYPNIFLWSKPVEGCKWFLITHVVRQSGHFFYEKTDRDIEKLKFGHKDDSKKEAVVFLMFAGIIGCFRRQIEGVINNHVEMTLAFEQYVSLIALLTVVPHYVQITYEYGYLRGFSWVLKILTDPFTDLTDFYQYWAVHPKYFTDLKEHNVKYLLDIKTKKTTKLN